MKKISDKKIILAIVFIAAAALVYNFLSGSNEQPRINCTSNDTDIFCATVYDPVCGWFDAEKIQCVKYPCAQTFSNSCFACSDDKVKYYTEGACPV